MSSATSSEANLVFLVQKVAADYMHRPESDTVNFMCIHNSTQRYTGEEAYTKNTVAALSVIAAHYRKSSLPGSTWKHCNAGPFKSNTTMELMGGKELPARVDTVSWNKDILP